jgi:hypothetical protein
LKLGVVSILRNEGNGVRVFVNHLGALFDYAILMDHSSIDSTAQILSEACQEYTGWRSWQIMASGFHQVSYSTFAMQALFEHSDADYVIFLDADELVDVPQRSDLENALSQLKGNRTVGLFSWRNCAPLDWSGRPLSFGDRILASLQLSPFTKVAMPRRVFEETGGTARPRFGNHDIDPGDGKGVLYQNVGELLHMPIRSLEQIKRKLTTRALTNFATVGRPLNKEVLNRRLGLIAEGIMREEDLLPLALTYGEEIERGAKSLGYLPRNLQVAHVSDLSQLPNISLDPYRVFAELLKNWKQEDAADGQVVLRGTELHLVPAGLELNAQASQAAAEGRRLQFQSSQSAKEVRQLQEQIENLNLTLQNAILLHHNMSRSLSWRLTKPFRVVRDAGARSLIRARHLAKTLGIDPSMAKHATEEAVDPQLGRLDALGRLARQSVDKEPKIPH